MSEDTRTKLINSTLDLMRSTDPNHISVRQVAGRTGIRQSVIYHYFPAKHQLLHAAFLAAQRDIRQALEDLPPMHGNAQRLMRQRIEYQLDNAHLIVPMLRYFMAFKHLQPDKPGGFIPAQAYRHIKEAIDEGVKQGMYATKASEQDAKVIVHAINGFVLEYHPINPVYKENLINVIQQFVERALIGNERRWHAKPAPKLQDKCK